MRIQRAALALSLILIATATSAHAATKHDETEAQAEGRRAQAQQSSGTAKKPHRSAADLARELTARLGKCNCTLDPDSHEADDKPIGRIDVRDLHDDAFKISVVNEELALAIFQKMTSEANIPFGFPEDGCYARAHEMSYQLAKDGIETGKVFATGVFRMNNDKAENGHLVWGFHVAPVIAVARGPKRELWVIDPSLFYEPVPILKWLSKLTEQPKSHLTTAYITTKFVYHPNHKDRKLHDFDQKDLRAAQKMMKRYLRAEIRRERVPADEDDSAPKGDH